RLVALSLGAADGPASAKDVAKRAPVRSATRSPAPAWSEQRHRRARGTSVAAGAGDSSLKDLPLARRLHDVSGNSLERHLDAPVPARILVAGVLAHADVDEPLVGWSLNVRAEQTQRCALGRGGVAHAQFEVERQVAIGREATLLEHAGCGLQREPHA